MNLPEIAPRHQAIVEQADKNCFAEIRKILGVPPTYDFVKELPKQALLSQEEFDAMQEAVRKDVIVRATINDLYRKPGYSDVYALDYVKTIIQNNLILTIRHESKSNKRTGSK
jgi:hypothetical protein